MKLWAKKIDKLKARARKALFDARFFDRESKLEEIPTFDRRAPWQERVKAGYEAAQKEPETTTPRVSVSGWVFGLGFQPGERDGKNPTWHMLAIAMPYRRPLYDNDWKTLAGVLGHLRVPATVVEAECEHWTQDAPFAPFRFVWTPLALTPDRDLPSHERFLLEYYGWYDPWVDKIDILRALAHERTLSGPSLTREEAQHAVERARKADAGGYKIEIDNEFAEKATKGQTRIVLCGWSFVANRIHEDGKAPEIHMSAKLFPFGRGSKERDWRFLGEALSRYGVPRPFDSYKDGGSLVTPIETTPPNQALHWHWTEKETAHGRAD